MAKIVMIGSARIDENGNAHGGKAGDQKNGKEVSTQEWYKHPKGWRVFRAKDPEKAEIIAKTMEWACESDLIGYDQYQRNTLYNELKMYAFEKYYLSKAVETDCSALVRVCLAFAGIDVPADFYTASMAKTMLATGEIVELTGSKYTDAPDYLARGDILVTKTKGHAVVVLNDGEKHERVKTSADPDMQMIEIVSKGGSVNIRTGNDTKYAKIAAAMPGTQFPYVATAINGWNAVEIEGQIGWVSGKYSQLVNAKVKAIPDISRWQGSVDFDALAPEVEFVIARGMYETGKDVYIDGYAAEMTRLGIPFGVYQYSIATTPEEARAEARAFYEAMKGLNPLFYVLDAESDGLDAALIGVWAEEMRKLGAKKLGCYVAHNHYDDYEYDTVRGEFDFTWIPRYGSNDGTVEGSKKPAYACDLWQYTSKGSIPGMKGNVDLNLIAGDKGVDWFRSRNKEE